MEKAPIKEIGKLSAGMIVAAARFKNKKITITTKPMVSNNVRFTSWMASLIDFERSINKFTLMDAGICASNLGTILRTASTTSTELAVGWRKIAKAIERSPL